MDLQELRQEAIKIIKANPELKPEIQDLFSLAISEVEEGGSESHECDLAYNDMIELQNEANNNKMVKGGKLTGPQQAKFDKVMSEWKAGKLHSGSSDGPIVKDQDQAIAIAYAQANSMKKMEFGGLVYDSLSDEAKDRMEGLVPIEQMNNVLSNCRYIVSDMMEEGFELDEAISFIVYKIVDDFTDKRMGYFSEEYYPEDWKETGGKMTGGSIENDQIEEYAEAIYEDLRQEYKPWELQNMSMEEAMMSVDSYDEIPENLKEQVASYLMNMASQNEFFEEDEEDEEYKNGGVIENKMQSLENELDRLESELKWTQQQNGASKQYYLRKRRSGKMTRERAMQLIDESNASWKKEREKVREKIKEVKDKIKRLQSLSSKVSADEFSQGGGVGQMNNAKYYWKSFNKKQKIDFLVGAGYSPSVANDLSNEDWDSLESEVHKDLLSSIMAKGGGVDDSKNKKIMESYREWVSDIRNQSYPRMSVSGAVKLASEYMLNSYSRQELIEAIKTDKNIDFLGMEKTWLNALRRAKKPKMATGGGVDDDDVYFATIINKKDPNYNRLAYSKSAENTKDKDGNEFDKLYFENKKTPLKYNVKDLNYNVRKIHDFKDVQGRKFMLLKELQKDKTLYYYIVHSGDKKVYTESGNMNAIKEYLKNLTNGKDFYSKPGINFADGGGVNGDQ
jgi:hypothetical protein